MPRREVRQRLLASKERFSGPIANAKCPHGEPLYKNLEINYCDTCYPHYVNPFAVFHTNHRTGDWQGKMRSVRTTNNKVAYAAK